MTAPPANQTASPMPPTGSPSAGHGPPGRGPTLSAAFAAASLGVLAWAVYFIALVAVYVLAYNRRVVPCQVAAGWGLAIAFAAALLIVPLAVNWLSAPWHASPQVPRGLALVPGALLTLGAVAVIWVAVNLTIAGDTAGAWMLAICSAVTPVAVLLARLAVPPARLVDDEAAAGPVTEPVIALPGDSGPVSPAAGSSQVAAPEVTSTEVTSTEVTSDHTGNAEAAAPGLAATGVVMPAQTAFEAAGPEVLTVGVAAPSAALDDGAVAELEALVLDKGARDVIARNPLLVRDWASRLGAEPPRVAVDMGMWDVVLSTLGRRGLEVGGVALTIRVPGTVIIFGLVLPQQVKVSGAFCEFRAEEVSRVRDAIDGVSDILGLEPAQVQLTWVHTHPGLGLFMSSTDRATAATWRAFDDKFTPIVLDPLAQRVSDQIGVFDKDNRKINNLRIVSGLVDVHAVRKLRDELMHAYRAATGTMVLFGGG